MAAEAWKKEIALIYLPLIRVDRCIVPRGLKCTLSANWWGWIWKGVKWLEDTEVEDEIGGQPGVAGGGGRAGEKRVERARKYQADEGGRRKAW